MLNNATSQPAFEVSVLVRSNSKQKGERCEYSHHNSDVLPTFNISKELHLILSSKLSKSFLKSLAVFPVCLFKRLSAMLADSTVFKGLCHAHF